MKKERQNNTKLATKMAAYAATALSALAVANPVSAAIVYNGPHTIDVPINGNIPVNLDGDANDDVRLTLTSGASWSFRATGVNSGRFIEYKGVEHLAAGYLIQKSLGKSIQWNAGPEPLAGSSSYGTLGRFTNNPGYMGVRFHTAQCQGTDWNYGWISIHADGSGGHPGTVQIVDWAYEADCNTAIEAGATVSPAPPPPPVPVPTLDEWALIALVALLSGTGLSRMKKGQTKT